MDIEIKYKDKKGASHIQRFSNYDDACNTLLILFNRRIESRLYVDNIITGEVYKQDGRYNYYYPDQPKS